MKKRVVLLIAVAALLVFAAGAIAGSNIEAIQANLAHDFKFVVDGEDFVPMDGDAKLSAIVYNDRTYLPVRALGDAIGVKVDWDNDTRTVILGEAAAVVTPEPEDVEEPEEVEEPADVEEPEEIEEPAADLAIAPTAVNLSKSNVEDIVVDVTWGPASEITAMKGSAMNGLVNIEPEEGKHYTVDGNVLTIKKEVTALLPVDIGMVPAGTTLTLTITFDDGSQELAITVVD
ncbi:MAG: hypothetical protein GX333_00395 [Syntrophomonadaceae bacterium]|nr:hypothetical protein [Syntrophomonadaceae bacterium]